MAVRPEACNPLDVIGSGSKPDQVVIVVQEPVPLSEYRQRFARAFPDRQGDMNATDTALAPFLEADALGLVVLHRVNHEQAIVTHIGVHL